MKQSEKSYKRLVIKIGASLLYNEKKELDTGYLKNICEEIVSLLKENREVVIVSSGAIAMGMSILGIKDRPKELSLLQAIASVGQNRLMQVYQDIFGSLGFNCAQILLTWDDFSYRQRYLNAKNTINTLLKLKIIPIINENDTVSTKEIKLGDNDRLSALVAGLINANLLIILSDVDGLYDRKNNQLISVVQKIDEKIKSLASFTDKATSVGGMVTKIESAKIAVESGIPCLILNGRKKGLIEAAVRTNRFLGTLFLPCGEKLTEKERWFAFSSKIKGRIKVDKGASYALMHNKSLLAVGIIDVEGEFKAKDIVGIIDEQGREFARGRVNFSSEELRKVKGKHINKEVIHCDNIVILKGD